MAAVERRLKFLHYFLVVDFEIIGKKMMYIYGANISFDELYRLVECVCQYRTRGIDTDSRKAQYIFIVRRKRSIEFIPDS